MKWLLKKDELTVEHCYPRAILHETQITAEDENV